VPPELYTHRVRVRYSECDAQGVVFNGQYLFLYDVALTEFFREAIGPYDEMVQSGADLVVAEASLRYLAGARFDDLVDIEMPIAKLGTTSMTVTPTFRVDGRPMVEGEVRHVFVDPGTGKKREIPDEVRRALEPYALG
jgi:acyl-CoA thioester hydrolase